MTDQWSKLPRFTKLASALYVDHVSADLRAEMETISRGEGKRLRGANLIPDHLRGACSPIGGQAVKSPPTKRRV
jgi:hypothetical protein